MNFKLTTIVISLLFSAVCNATPIVGDYASYEVKDVGADGKVWVGTREIEVLKIDKGIVTAKITHTQSGQAPEVSQEVYELALFWTDSAIDNYLSNCESSWRGGVVETLNISGQMIKTCKVHSDSSETNYDWIGKVPFGDVQQIFIWGNGGSYSETIKSLRPGK